jgi:carboxypeptidase D
MLNQITYPPKGKINLPNGNKDVVPSGCDLFDTWYDEASEINECFNIYRVTDQCPTPTDNIE